MRPLIAILAVFAFCFLADPIYAGGFRIKQRTKTVVKGRGACAAGACRPAAAVPVQAVPAPYPRPAVPSPFPVMPYPQAPAKVTITPS